MADAWNEGTWGQGFWGQQSSITVSVTGVSASTTLGTESVVADSVVTLNSLQVTSALGTAVGEPENVFFPTGVSFETQLSGVTVGEGTSVVLGSLLTSFAVGTETGSGTVDAGWGRAEWGSFEWNANIEFITNVSAVTMSTALGTTTQEVGTGVIVSVTGLDLTSTLGTTSQVGTSEVTLGSLTVGAALSGASGITGEGNVVAMNTALGTPTIQTGTGVIVSVSTVALTFTPGTVTPSGAAIVDLTGLSSTFELGQTFSTPWANVVTGASNTWTEVDAA